MAKELKPTILLIEDEDAIASIIKYNLKKEGYHVISASDGEEGYEVAKRTRPDVILLDWVLPSMQGIDVCKMLRKSPETSNVPVIMISSKKEDIDKVMGLEYGADDYMVKPFSQVELIARIKAVLRRIRPAFSGKELSFLDISLDLGGHKVTRGGKEIKLSPIEFKILQILMENPGRVISRDSLMDKIWGNEVFVGVRTVDVHITRLRKALLDYSKDNHDVIKTIRLAGYTLVSSNNEEE